jgi:hypothetical protein
MPRIFTSRASTSSASYMRGRAPLMTRPLHKFIGAAIGTRNEVLSILHMLDKPEAVWEDATADRIYMTCVRNSTCPIDIRRWSTAAQRAGSARTRAGHGTRLPLGVPRSNDRAIDLD